MNRTLKKVGLNRQMTDKKLSLTFLEPFNFLSEMHVQTEYSSIPDELIYENNFKTQQESGLTVMAAALAAAITVRPQAARHFCRAASRGRAKRARGLCRHLPRVRVSGAQEEN